MEAIEAASLSSLDFIGELFDEVFIDDAIRSSEEGEEVGNEMVLVVIQLV